jgi:hypothetical protein
MRTNESSPTLDGLTWVKSTRSGSNGGACVEVARGQNVVGVRDSKDCVGGRHDGPRLPFHPSAWSAFVDAVKAGTLV